MKLIVSMFLLLTSGCSFAAGSTSKTSQSKKRLSCECGYTCCYTSQMVCHQWNEHDIDTPGSVDEYVCPFPECAGRAYVNLATHTRKHTGAKPYKCQHCDRCFADYSTLRNHKRIHTEKKPYQCDYCGQHFRQLGHVKAHETKKHLNTVQAQAVQLPAPDPVHVNHDLLLLILAANLAAQQAVNNLRGNA